MEPETRILYTEGEVVTLRGGTVENFANETGTVESIVDLQPTTQQVNIVIVRADQEVRLYEGVPYDWGVDEASVYVVFIYARCLVTVWVSGELEPHERQPVSKQILNYVNYRTRVM